MTNKFKDDWPSKKRPSNKSGRIPFNYVVKEDDEFLLVPDEFITLKLEEALDKLDDNASLREVADWLFVQVEGKRELTPQGLNFIWKQKRSHLDTPRAKRLKDLKVGVPKAREKAKNYRRGRKLTAAKNRLNAAKRKIDQLEEQKKRQEEIGANSKAIVFDFEETKLDNQPEPLFKANPGPQEFFLSASESQVLYGGAAGGGKSFALLADPIRYFGNKNFSGLLVRRTNDELRDLKWQSRELYQHPDLKGKWREKDSMWLFPSGARLWMSYLDRDEDVSRYQGMAFTWIGFDELTHWSTPFVWNYLQSRLRTPDPDLRPYVGMRATTNPGGPGHQWVKKMFIDPAPPGKTFKVFNDAGQEIVNPVTKLPMTRRFIPAKLSDNPYLADDGAYEMALQSLPEAQRKKLLEGSWDVMEGAAFPEYDANIHVIEPFPIPASWLKFRAADYGYANPTAVLWIAINPSTNQLVVYRELYGSGITGRQLAHSIQRLEQDEYVRYGVLDRTVWRQTGQTGPSVADEMISEGVRWQMSNSSKGSRIHGKNKLHELLKIDEFTGEPGIVFFNTCRQLLTDLPTLPVDPNGKEDIDEKFVSDHTYDALRYGIMSRFNMTTPVKDYSTPHAEYADNVFGY